MGKGERRGGRAGRRARHHHHHFQRHRRRRGGGGGGGVPLSFSGPGAARSYTTLGVCFLIHAIFIILSGIPVIVLLADVSLMPLVMFGIGGALLVAGAFLCARGKRRAAKEAATSPAGQDAGASQPQQTAGTQPQLPPQGTLLTAPDPTAFGGTIPGQPMADFSYPSAGQPYPGSQPYPGPAAAGGFGPAPSAPPPSGPAPPPQYGFTYNTSDNYNTQYSAGTSDLPPPPAYSTVVNEKL